MTNNAFQKVISLVSTFAGIMSAAMILFHISGLSAQEKPVPDHGSFKDCQPCHSEKYKAWEATRHSKAIERLTSLPKAGADCFACHAAEGFSAKIKDSKIDPANAGTFQSVSCLACHNPGSKTNPKQLAMNSEKLCVDCHSQQQGTVLAGKGARGIEDTRSFHSAVPCASCHMSEANHGFKVIRPDDPKLPDDRLDTCTLCHKDNNRKARAKQLADWQSFYKEAMDPVEADITAINARLKEKPDLLNADLKAKLSAINSNLTLIRRDRSRGAHNLDFALEILSKASKDIKEIKAAIKM